MAKNVGGAYEEEVVSLLDNSAERVKALEAALSDTIYAADMLWASLQGKPVRNLDERTSG